MKKYAADNLMFLRDQYPEIYKLVRNRNYDHNKFSLEEAKNGQKNLRVRLESDASYSFYSKYNPELETQRWAESLDEMILRSNDVLLAGFGLGYHAEAFLNQYPDKRLYIYEPDPEVFIAAIEAIDLRKVLGDHRIAMFALGQEEAVLTQLLLGMYKSLKGLFGYAIVPFSRKLYPDLENTLNTQVPKLALSYGTDMRTISHYKAEWLENLILNMERNLRTPSFYPLKDFLKGVPAIIAGSGPSLGMEAERLLQLRNHAFIIAAGSSIQGLLHHGIEPHLVVSMDGGEPNERVFSKLDIGHIPFLYIPSIKYTAIKNDRSPYLMHGFFDIDVVSNYFVGLSVEDGVLATTSSVTGTCIQVAAHLGCNEITFIGQDFSYPGERMYSAGVNHQDVKWAEKEVGQADLTVPNIAGGFNRTTYSLLNLKQDVESVIKVFPDTTFYNASQVGAVIDHTFHRSMEEMQKQYSRIVVPEDEFRDTIAKKLLRDFEQRSFTSASKINLATKQISDLSNNLRELKQHIRKPHSDISSWLREFEVVWSSVIEHPLYEQVLSFFLSKEKNRVERYWSDVYQEHNLVNKKAKLLACIEPLLTGLNELVPLMDRCLSDLSQKLKE